MPSTPALTAKNGTVPAKKVDVIDTTGAGDAFFAGTTIGLTYGKSLAEACEIGSRLAASVICISENVCPRFRPLEFGLDCRWWIDSAAKIDASCCVLPVYSNFPISHILPF